MQRPDDFQERRQKVAHLSDEELIGRFWELTEKVVDPLVRLARGHTSPSIERSVLLRMGFSSLDAKAIVDKAVEHGLLGKGVGHVILRVAQASGRDYREAGRELAEGKHWDEAVGYFRPGPALKAGWGELVPEAGRANRPAEVSPND